MKGQVNHIAQGKVFYAVNFLYLLAFYSYYFFHNKVEDILRDAIPNSVVYHSFCQMYQVIWEKICIFCREYIVYTTVVVVRIVC